MRHIAIALLLSFGLGCLFVSLRSMPTAHAQPAQFSPPVAGAPSGSAIHDPAESPAAAIDDFTAAKKQHWALAALAAVIMLAKAATFLGGRFSWAAWLAQGTRAVVISSLLVVAVAAYNALLQGGSWFAVAGAALLATFSLQPATAPKRAVELADARVVSK